MQAPVQPHVLSVCHRRDLWIWRYSQHLIPFNLNASSFTLIVDDNDISLFKIFTTSLAWEIIPSSSVLPNHFLLDLKASCKTINASLNTGWYWQQFLKIQYIVNQDTGVYVIWDSDTIPLKKINFPSTSIGFYQPSVEFHKPYWLFNEFILGREFGIYPGFSFISQFMGINSDVARSLSEHICEYRQVPDWRDAAIQLIPHIQTQHRMSEYELLGSFALNSFAADRFIQLTLPWTRNGASITKSPLYLTLKEFTQSEYSYAAFERRDIQGWSVSSDRALRFLSLLLSRAANSLMS